MLYERTRSKESKLLASTYRDMQSSLSHQTPINAASDVSVTPCIDKTCTVGSRA
jgi:hypothetical protein